MAMEAPMAAVTKEQANLKAKMREPFIQPTSSQHEVRAMCESERRTLI